MSGLKLVEVGKKEFPDLSFIIMSSDASEYIHHRAREIGVCGFFPKGSNAEEILKMIDEAVC